MVIEEEEEEIAKSLFQNRENHTTLLNWLKSKDLNVILSSNSLQNLNQTLNTKLGSQFGGLIQLFQHQR